MFQVNRIIINFLTNKMYKTLLLFDEICYTNTKRLDRFMLLTLRLIDDICFLIITIKRGMALK